VNLGGIRDDQTRDSLRARLTNADETMTRADRVTAQVRESLKA
jgi:hypothetical protein